MADPNQGNGNNANARQVMAEITREFGAEEERMRLAHANLTGVDLEVLPTYTGFTAAVKAYKNRDLWSNSRQMWKIGKPGSYAPVDMFCALASRCLQRHDDPAIDTAITVAQRDQLISKVVTAKGALGEEAMLKIAGTVWQQTHSIAADMPGTNFCQRVRAFVEGQANENWTAAYDRAKALEEDRKAMQEAHQKALQEQKAANDAAIAQLQQSRRKGTPYGKGGKGGKGRKNKGA